jgi:hypothetical protein
MAVTAGSYTVGSGGNYATWYAALSDMYNQTLTGDLTFTQISDVTETQARGSMSPNLGGFRFTITSNSPHYGDITRGWKTTLNYNSSSAYWLYPFQITGNNSIIEVKNLRFLCQTNAGTIFPTY